MNYTFGMLLKHVYNASGYYIVTVNTNNPVSYGTFQTSIRIITTTCFRPIVTIMSASTDFQNPTIVNCGYDTALNAQLNINCPSANGVIRQWTVERINKTTGDVLSTLSLNASMFTGPNTLTLPAGGAQCFGTLRVTLVVTVNVTAVNVSGSAIVYIRVMPSAIIAKLVNSLTTTFTLGTLDTIIVQPFNNSVNPNEPSNSGHMFDGLQYICRQTNESWPNDNGALLMPLAGNGQYPVASVSATNNVSGCFGQGAGGLSATDPSWTIAGAWFQVGYQYNMGVRIWKTYYVDGGNISVHAETTIILNIVTGTPPNLRIM